MGCSISSIIFVKKKKKKNKRKKKFKLGFSFAGDFTVLMSSSERMSSPPPPKQYGVTKPISMAGPTEADIQRNRELEKVLFYLWL